MNKHQDTTDEFNSDLIRRETDRVEIFSDAVFAIVITLLALEFKIPSTYGTDPVGALLSMWPSFLAYFLSFLIIGSYWIEHHNIFNFICKSDRKMMLYNLFFLMSIAIIPFPTHLVSEFNALRASVIFYGVILLFVSIFLYWFWSYVTNDHRLVDNATSAHTVRLIKRKIIIEFVLYSLGIAVAFFSPPLSLIIYSFVVISIIIPNPLEKMLNRARKELVHN